MEVSRRITATGAVSIAAVDLYNRHHPHEALGYLTRSEVHGVEFYRVPGASPRARDRKEIDPAAMKI